MFDNPFSPGVGFKVLLQRRCLLFCLNSYGRVDFPWREFGGVWHVPSVVRFESCSQVRGMANIEVGVSGGIPQDVNVVEV